MFAVPGWSVSNSALKQQTEPASQPKNNASQKPDAKSKKRKRGNDNVTKGNVDQMYRRHIEGHQSAPKDEKPAGTKPGKSEKKRKKEQNSQAQKGGSELKQDTGSEKQQSDNKPGPRGHGEGEGKKGSKTQKQNDKNKHQVAQEDTQPATDGAAMAESLPAAPPATEAKLTPLQQAMRQKLISSRFRHLNETLYTAPSSKALELFSTNPELFDEYHAGFSRQVKESWPSNPVDGYVQAIRTRGAISPPKKGKKPDKSSSQGRPLPRRPNGGCTITDLGCGDAQLASSLGPSAQKLDLKLFNYDLHAPNSLVTKADVSNLPVDDGSVDVAVFCLSLMGTNWVSFVEEAWRVLRGDGKGECWVSEVKSRFGRVVRQKSQPGPKKPLSKTEKKKLKKKGPGADNDPGSDVDETEIYAEDARPGDGDETDISAFVEVFRTRGFVLKPESVDMSNKMFVKMEFVKQGGPPTKGKYAAPGAAAGSGKKRFIEKSADADSSMTPEEEASVLKPCVYKNR
ncbi:hypothetical protein PHISP_01136 [Aspergillus sp. HF37]|nr:hypothetical protein PHISP_01136 [Aspergillus sp. HF37]